MRQSNVIRYIRLEKGAFMATIKDVAELAEVSVATVSRVLNDGGNVQPETAERVRCAIAELNYSPNLLGRNLRRNETKKILVLLNTISNQYYARVVKGVEECARTKDYTVMVCMTHGDPAIEAKFIQMLKTRLVDGAVFLTAVREGAALNQELSGLCVVQACEPVEGFFAPSVSIDNERAAYDATCYLLHKGHKSIAYFGATGGFDSAKKRREGYLRALREANIRPRMDWILEEGFTINAGTRAAKRLFAAMRTREERLPTAVFCIADSVAAGAIREFFRQGVSTPEDISVMGFDNTQLSEVYLPSITTTRQPQFEIGYQAMALLLRRIANEAIEQQALILPHEIIGRDSVKHLNVRKED